MRPEKLHFYPSDAGATESSGGPMWGPGSDAPFQTPPAQLLEAHLLRIRPAESGSGREGLFQGSLLTIGGPGSGPVSPGSLLSGSPAIAHVLYPDA